MCGLLNGTSTVPALQEKAKMLKGKLDIQAENCSNIY